MPLTDWGYLVTRDEFESWILHEDDGVLIVNKPGGLVCHPSKRGPWSSLIGAAREYLEADRLHMPSRLDRETSGVVVFAKKHELGAELQRAIERRRVEKQYLAVLRGELAAATTVKERLGRAVDAAVSSLQEIRADGKEAVTVFEPIGWANGYTLARIRPETGRMHQIRVHAAWMGAPVAGDKMYAAGEECYLEFVRHGFTPRLRESLQASRHLLHAESIRFPGIGAFLAPMAEDMLGFWANQAFASTDAALRT